MFWTGHDGDCVYLVLQWEDGGFVDVEFDGDLGPAGADVTVGAGGVQDTGHQELLAQVGMLVEEDLEDIQTDTERHGTDSLATVKTLHYRELWNSSGWD